MKKSKHPNLKKAVVPCANFALALFVIVAEYFSNFLSKSAEIVVNPTGFVNTAPSGEITYEAIFDSL